METGPQPIGLLHDEQEPFGRFGFVFGRAHLPAIIKTKESFKCSLRYHQATILNHFQPCKAARNPNYFGDLYRRWRARLGSPKAITAMAHKLARILWHLLKYRQPFNPEVFAREEEKMKRKKLARLHNLAASLNCQLIPQP